MDLLTCVAQHASCARQLWRYRLCVKQRKYDPLAAGAASEAERGGNVKGCSSPSYLVRTFLIRWRRLGAGVPVPLGALSTVETTEIILPQTDRRSVHSAPGGTRGRGGDALRAHLSRRRGSSGQRCGAVRGRWRGSQRCAAAMLLRWNGGAAAAGTPSLVRNYRIQNQVLY